MKSKDIVVTSTIPVIAADGITRTNGGCPALNQQCTRHANHNHHAGPDNLIAAVRPTTTSQPLAMAALVAFDDYDGGQPYLNVSFDAFDGDLTLAEVDQLIAGLRDFTRRLTVQAAHLAAANRMAEAQ
jgi:hypothetical protein